ncbi:uncharacterized protein A4U43_C03F30900 [Asparagus officinalis]|uniref:Uncharacterized protein n=1 Tax=Asparagus officinalis TaxID=4686 RepID=A0A5P1FE95_ASPOF|nr:uncharacterized protein A4U43_C03F30900 [Asparagus officinalis]
MDHVDDSLRLGVLDSSSRMDHVDALRLGVLDSSSRMDLVAGSMRSGGLALDRKLSAIIVYDLKPFLFGKKNIGIKRDPEKNRGLDHQAASSSSLSKQRSRLVAISLLTKTAGNGNELGSGDTEYAGPA